MRVKNKNILPVWCGIYQIINPIGHMYIGQSKRILHRMNDYQRVLAKGQPRLENSFKKYGYENHTFIVLKLCPLEMLNEFEIFYIKHFDTFDTEHGMNLRPGGCVTTFSKETREKLRKNATGNTNWVGRKHSQATKDKMSISGRGRPCSDETREKYRKVNTGRKHTPETRKKMSEIRTGIKRPIKLLLNLETGIYYFSILGAAQAYNIGVKYLTRMLSGNRKNKTPLIYA